MLSSRNRFQGRNSLTPVYRKGRVVRQSDLQLRTLATQNATFRLAVVVSKKVHKSAVVRNRIRRRLYELARMHLSTENRQDIIITVFDVRLATMTANEVQRSVVKLFQKAHLRLADAPERAIVETEV